MPLIFILIMADWEGVGSPIQNDQGFISALREKKAKKDIYREVYMESG